MKTRSRSVKLPVKSVLVAVMALGFYVSRIRPWLLSWGATQDELVAQLPGDDIVAEPRCSSTRAVEIAADPQDVWPWLAQLGQGRGGLYSYEWLENLFGCDIHNLDYIAPQLQRIAQGDRIRLVPEGFKVDLAFEVAEAEPNHALVLNGLGTREEAFVKGLPYPSWAFVIHPVAPNRVKLIIRWRSDFAPTPSGYLWSKYGIEPVHFLMERKMLKGIKERAETLRAKRNHAGIGNPDQPDLEMMSASPGDAHKEEEAQPVLKVEPLH
jgi:hypothetical protein